MLQCVFRLPFVMDLVGVIFSAVLMKNLGRRRTRSCSFIESRPIIISIGLEGEIRQVKFIDLFILSASNEMTMSITSCEGMQWLSRPLQTKSGRGAAYSLPLPFKATSMLSLIKSPARAPVSNSAAALIAGGGAVVSVSSLVATVPAPPRPAYLEAS